MPPRLTIAGCKPGKHLQGMGYAKLFSSITESSLWSEPKEVRLLFVTMIAKARADGFVEASVPGLARVANLSLSETQQAIELLEAPDTHSKNPDNDGRRIAPVPGGWMVLNYELYRNRQSEEERKEYMRDYMRRYRSVNTPLTDVKKCKEIPSASASASASVLDVEKKGLVFPQDATEAFRSKFEKWTGVRKAMGKKPKDWNDMFQEQLDWLAQYVDADRIEVLSASIRGNWQGLFPPGHKNGKAAPESKPAPKGENVW